MKRYDTGDSAHNVKMMRKYDRKASILFLLNLEARCSSFVVRPSSLVFRFYETRPCNVYNEALRNLYVLPSLRRKLFNSLEFRGLVNR